ncbi:MAG: Calx-beta domain-containing protein, partial [Pseudomonadota bacterium]
MNKTHLRSSLATFFVASLAGCALLTGPSSIPDESLPKASAMSIDCTDANAMPDKVLAAALDISELLLAQLKDGGKTNNNAVCGMTWDQRAAIMVAERDKQRSPLRRQMRAPSKEYIRSWDADDNGNLPNASQILAADGRRKAMTFSRTAPTKAAGVLQSRWTALGPGNVGGRLRAIIVDPRNPSRIFVGSATGGIWLSTNGGQSFSPVADFVGNISIGAMAIDPSNPNVMYAGTGESFGGFVGVGIFKSTDSGLTWNLLPSTSTDTSINPSGADWVTTNRVAVHRTNTNIVLAGNGGGIYRSTDGGQSWARVRSSATLDVKFDPVTADRVVASGAGGFVFYSTDAGLTWTDAPKFFTNALRGRGTSARAELTWAQATPNLVYASVDNTDQTSGARGEVYKSIDGGITWTFVSSPKHLSEQGDYDNTIWVDPLDANHVIVGGLDLHRSTDGGLTFTKISDWRFGGPGNPQPHADHHVIVEAPNYSPGNPVVYFGNDGGLYRSSNITTAGATGTTSWANLNNGLAITQFYGGAGSLAAGGKIIGGTQDNGDLRYTTGTTWARIGGGDGGFAAVDPIDDATVYGEYVYASIRRYGGGGSGQICNGITEGKKDESNITYCGPSATEQTNFISPFILDPNQRDRMLVGANSLWVSDDVRTPTAPAWRSIKPPVTNPNSTRYISAIAVQNGNSNVIWVGHNASNTTGLPTQIFKTTTGLAVTPDWVNMAQAGMPTSAINRLTIDPGNPNRVWVSYSGFSANRLWVTEDGGATWRSISAGLPAMTIHDMKRHPTQTNWLYVAAANGVYTSEDSGTTWTSTNDGPNSVRVRELIWYDNFTLVAVTYGRGMFKATAIPDNGLISFQPTNYTVAEGAGSVTLTVQRIGSISSAATVNYATQGGTATSGADFTATSGVLSWPAGDGSSRIITVPIIDDAIAEAAETFTVVLSNATGGTIGSGTATV